jgi:hypothetical protein
MRYPFSVLFFVATLFCAFPHAAQAATLSFSAPATVSPGETFTLEVLVDSAERGFNAAEAQILFPRETFEVLSIDSSPSSTIFNFWLNLPSFENEEGVVSFSGGTTRGVVGADIQILSVQMRAVGSGDALITATNASVNAADGSGTNILEGITALRIAVSGAPLTVPAKPAPAPTDEEKNNEELAPAPVGPAEELVPAPDEDEGCVGLFANCDLRFPLIESLDIQLHEQVGADLVVSGVAAEGAHVHLLLLRGEVPYEEITAIIQSDRKWEGALSNIFAYGTYALHVWVESADNNHRSETVVQENIEIYPPLTLHPFGYVIRWYAFATALLGILVGLLALPLILRHVVRHERFHFNRTAALLVVATLAFLSMFITAFSIWQKEYRSADTFWKDTDITCILRAPSYIDVYRSAHLSIQVDGVEQQIPAGLGFSPTCVAQIHTLDNTGRVHIKPTGRPITLLDFFTVAGIPFVLEEYGVSVSVNGEESTDRVASYQLQNGDSIVVTYTTLPLQQ